MVRPFDVSKSRKSILPSINVLSVGFHDLTDWISTGSDAKDILAQIRARHTSYH